jgi:hypothetical protein
LAKRIEYSVRLPAQLTIHPACMLLSFTKSWIEFLKSAPGNNLKINEVSFLAGIEI